MTQAVKFSGILYPICNELLYILNSGALPFQSRYAWNNFEVCNQHGIVTDVYYTRKHRQFYCLCNKSVIATRSYAHHQQIKLHNNAHSTFFFYPSPFLQKQHHSLVHRTNITQPSVLQKKKINVHIRLPIQSLLGLITGCERENYNFLAQ